MPRTRVPLTRSTLLETERSLALARQGYELLDRKREILLGELTVAIPVAENARGAVLAAFSGAYEELGRARMSLGTDRVRWAALAAADPPEVRVVERGVVGAVVPMVRCTTRQTRPTYSPSGTVAELDMATRSFSALVEAVCAAAQTESTVVRLAREVNKTQRRVNALRSVVIPTQEAIIKEVREALEDAEREAFFRAKMVRRREGR